MKNLAYKSKLRKVGHGGRGAVALIGVWENGQVCNLWVMYI
ncbi:hypothetical protein [Dorea formicigenerans]